MFLINKIDKLPITMHNLTSMHYMLFIFIFLYVILVLLNYDHLNIEINGSIAYYLVVFSIIMLLFYFLIKDNKINLYFLISAIILLIISIFVLFSTYDKYEIRDNFFTDPVNIGIIVLVIFGLVNLFVENSY